MPAIAVHHTATTDAPWDGPAAVAAMPNDAATLTYCHAWREAGAGDEKQGYKFPHHATKGGPANLAACRNGLARLPDASIPDGDRAGVQRHLQAHLDDAKPADAKSRALLDRVKLRAGGVLSRAGAPLTVHEQRALDGDRRALRAILRQACGVNTIDVTLASDQVRVRSAGAAGDRLEVFGTFTHLDDPFTLSDWLGDYTETMHSGSLDRTLGMAPDVQYTPNHNWDLIPMARTTAGSLDLHTDGTCDARVDGGRSDVAILASAIEGREMTAMSFAFWATQQEWNDDYTHRDLFEVDMDGGDVSPVTHPANPGTTGSLGIRKRQAAGLLRSRVPELLGARIRKEKRDGGVTPTTQDVLQQVLNYLVAADIAVDMAQPLLATLMGVADPDVDVDPDDVQPLAGAASSTEPRGMSLARLRLREDARRRTA